MIIGVSIMVLIVSSVVGAPADEPIHAVSNGSAQIKVLALPSAPTVIAAPARALPLGGTDIGSRASSDRGCAAVTEFKQGAVQLMERGHCALMQQDNIPEVWKCQSKFVRDCIGDFPSIGIRPSDTQDPKRQIAALESRHQNPSAGSRFFAGV
jgi:hypothetical protein